MVQSTYDTRKNGDSGEPLPKRLLVTNTILDDDQCGLLLIHPGGDLFWNRRLVGGFVRTYDVVEGGACFGDGFYNLG
jgi:hypothetical protein